MPFTVPVTEEEKKSPLYKYFERDIAPALPEKYEKIKTNPLTPEIALRAPDLNVLFEDGYLPGEFGYCRFDDGTCTVANITEMPGVTVEMFDWWFAWHGIEPLRYKIWDKEDHFYCRTRNLEQALDSSLSLKERYWNTVHDVKESMVGDGNAKDISISFRNPADIGFDPEKLKKFDGTIVCAGGPDRPGIMCHFVRPTADGVELRTRFWFGFGIVDGRPQRLLSPGAELPIGPMVLLLTHNVKEYTNLAAILPEVYAEFKDRFVI